MTTPQSLTEEQIELLRSLPWRAGWEINVPHKGIQALIHAEMACPGEKRGDGKYDVYRTYEGNVLIATIDAVLERERERVNGLAAELEDEHQTLVFEEGAQRPFIIMDGYADDEHTTVLGEGDTLIEALESAANPLSPDVLGDQKDKGKATGKGSLTAPEASEELPSSEGSRVADTDKEPSWIEAHEADAEAAFDRFMRGY